MATPTTKLMTFEQLFEDLSVLDGEESVICFNPFEKFAINPLNLTPTVIFGGQAATEKLCESLTAYARNLTPKTWLELDFRGRTDQSIHPNFATIPHKAFPADHPFRKNGAIEVLARYQNRTLLKENFTPPPYSKAKTRTCFLNAVRDQWLDLSADLAISHRTSPSVEAVILDPVSGFKVAYDNQMVIWVTTTFLRTILLK